MGSVVLLDLMGGVALLLWGLHMVQSGILRAFGSDLRQVLSKALGNRFAAFAVAIGLGLVLLSLHILLDTLQPAESAPGARVLLAAITGDPVMCILLAALLTWAAHSSVATVLLIMSLAYSAFITPAAALALVLGANLGSAINPVFEGGHRGDAASYRLPVGNLLNRLAGVVLVAPFLHPIADAMRAFQPDMARMTAEFHMAFNILLAVVFIGLLGPLARLLEKLLPARKDAADPASPRYLDETALE